MEWAGEACPLGCGVGVPALDMGVEVPAGVDEGGGGGHGERRDLRGGRSFAGLTSASCYLRPCVGATTASCAAAKQKLSKTVYF